MRLAALTPSWTSRASSLGRPAHRHSVVHVFTTWPLRASPLGLYMPLSHGRPARHHLAGHIVLHSATSRILTRPPRASPLGCAHLHHSAAPCVVTRLVTSSPLGRPARCHRLVTSSPLARPARLHRLVTSSPLGRPRVVTQLCTSSPLGHLARHHQLDMYLPLHPQHEND